MSALTPFKDASAIESLNYSFICLHGITSHCSIIHGLPFKRSGKHRPFLCSVPLGVVYEDVTADLVQ